MSDDEFGEFLTVVPEHQVTASHVIGYGFSAVVAAAAPAYLYMSLFNMSGEENYPIFAIVGLLTAAMLFYAYNNINKKINAKLFRERSGFVQTNVALAGKTRDEKKKAAQEHTELQKAVTEREGMSFAILYNNLFFLACVIVLGFFLLRQVPGTYNYVLASVVSAGLVTFSSTK